MPLLALESVLQTWLREQLLLPSDLGDISFTGPQAGWAGSLTRPTINLFLFEIARAAQQSVPVPPRRTGGALVQERPAPCVAFSFLLSAWGGGVDQEHRLLGEVVRAVLRSPSLSPGPDDDELLGPIQLSFAPPGEINTRELWAGLGVPLRAAMVLLAQAAVPLGQPRPVAPPVRTVLAEVSAKPAVPATATTTAGAPAATTAGATVATTTATAGATVTPDDLADDSARRSVWFGSRRQRGRGKP